MNIAQIITEIDLEIGRLQQAKSLLSGAGATSSPAPGRRGRPRKTAATATVHAAAPAKPGRKRGGMSAEGRRRIAEAQRKRWAAIKATKGK